MRRVFVCVFEGEGGGGGFVPCPVRMLFAFCWDQQER